MPTGNDIIAAAEKYTGVPYSQVNPQKPATGLDCSGVVELALSNLGITIPRTTGEQLTAAQNGQVGQDIGTNLGDAQPGDIIHYSGHEEVWLGGGQVFSEADYGTTAAVRNRTPETIVGIVRYSGAAGGASASTMSATSALDPVGQLTSWVGQYAARVGLMIFGGLLVLLGLVMAFTNKGAVKAVVSTAAKVAK